MADRFSLSVRDGYYDTFTEMCNRAGIKKSRMFEFMVDKIDSLAILDEATAFDKKVGELRGNNNPNFGKHDRKETARKHMMKTLADMSENERKELLLGFDV